MDLTILLVTRDRPHLLGGSIQSIVASAAAAAARVVTRVVVVDDSDDGSAFPVASALSVDYVRNPIRDAPFGQAAARAWMIPQVTTDLVAFFDDDDLMLEDHISLLADRIAKGGDVCSTGFWYADPDPADPARLVARRRQLVAQPRLGDLLVGSQPVNDGAMMKTEVAQSITWDPTWEILTMYHVWLQMLIAGRTFVVNRSATFLYRQHAASVSHNLGEREAVLQARLLAESRLIALERLGAIPGPSVHVRLAQARASVGMAVRGVLASGRGGA